MPGELFNWNQLFSLSHPFWSREARQNELKKSLNVQKSTADSDARL